MNISEKYPNSDMTSLGFENIPENNSVIKKRVHFKNEPNKIKKAPDNKKVSYDDILKNMGMVVKDGKLQLLYNNDSVNKTVDPVKVVRQPLQKQPPQPQSQQQQPNSYIYNKYFKENMDTSTNIRQPKTVQEYRDMLIMDIIQKEKIKQIKSRKLLMPTDNIHVSGGYKGANLNKLFDFSRK